ncbi:MAG TPA: DUF1080 domain-containing protein [Saprospiraceae bacterium]|nr:DUF1080 domain-containing protein [Saprospiraceae bacterium]
MKSSGIYGCLIGLLILSCGPVRYDVQDEEWVTLFNSRDLTGWTPKFSGRPVGENYKNTFVVQDSVLQVNYAEYDTFRNEFGHLFYKSPFKYYRLKMEYRFTGPPTPGAPAWAHRNNGVMILAQSPQSMMLDQDFPVSIEVQFLGGDGKTARPTGNLCTPGMHVYLNDTLATEHCINSRSATYHGDRWVKMEVLVLPDSTIHHLIEGDTVISYAKPVIGGDFLPEGYPLKEGSPVTEGYIALQAESHRTEFRNIRIQPIEQ